MKSCPCTKAANKELDCETKRTKYAQRVLLHRVQGSRIEEALGSKYLCPVCKSTYYVKAEKPMF